MIFALPTWQNVWHKICWGCHFGSFRAPPAILAVTPPYGDGRLFTISAPMVSINPLIRVELVRCSSVNLSASIHDASIISSILIKPRSIHICSRCSRFICNPFALIDWNPYYTAIVQHNPEMRLQMLGRISNFASKLRDLPKPFRGFASITNRPSCFAHGIPFCFPDYISTLRIVN